MGRDHRRLPPLTAFVLAYQHRSQYDQTLDVGAPQRGQRDHDQTTLAAICRRNASRWLNRWASFDAITTARACCAS